MPKSLSRNLCTVCYHTFESDSSLKRHLSHSGDCYQIWHSLRSQGRSYDLSARPVPLEVAAQLAIEAAEYEAITQNLDFYDEPIGNDGIPLTIDETVSSAPPKAMFMSAIDKDCMVVERYSNPDVFEYTKTKYEVIMESQVV